MRGVGIDLTLDFCLDPSVVLLALSFCSVGPDLFLSFFSFIIPPPPGKLGGEEVGEHRLRVEGGRRGSRTVCAEVKGQLMFGILITQRSVCPTRTNRRGLEVKTKAPGPMAAASFLQGCSCAFATGLAK